MAQPYVGEIRMFAGTFAPSGWRFCNGQPLPISENETLYQLIGTTYGGDGQETFNLPNLQSRVPIHMVSAPDLAATGGAEEITLTTQQIPIHNHGLLATTAVGTAVNPQDNILAAAGNIDLYRETAANTPMSNQSIGPVGGSQPHTNLQPYLCINFIISLFGIFPNPT